MARSCPGGSCSSTATASCPHRHRLLDPAEVPEQSRERAKRVSLAARIAEPPQTGERVPLRVERLVELADLIAGVRPPIVGADCLRVRGLVDTDGPEASVGL